MQNFFSKLTFGLIRIQGENAEKFLQGQLTCDVREISATKASLAAMCNPQGRIIASVFLCKYGNDYLFILPLNMLEIVIQHLNKYTVFSKVSLKNVTDDFVCLGFVGSQSLLSLTKISPAVPQQLFQVQSSSKQLLIYMYSSQPRVLFLTESSSSPVINELVHGLIEEPADTWHALDILDGIAMIYPETSLLFTPQMMNYEALDAISYKKGCYVGQEIIARTHYLGKAKRHLYRGLIKTAAAPKSGDLIYDDGKEIGVMSDVCTLEENKHLFLAVIQEHNQLTKLNSADTEFAFSDLQRLSE